MSNGIRTGLGLLSPSEVTGSVERALWAEERGYDSVWIPDGGGKMHALTLAGAVAARTKSIRIGTGIVPVYTHSPAVLASAAMTLGELAPGRVVLGIGASSHAMIEGWHGMDFHKPLTRVRETTELLRRMLAGEKVEYAGETLRTRGFQLKPVPERPIPLYLAALRPNMLELSGEIADGVILNLAPLAAIQKMIGHVEAGAKRAGRSLADVEIIVRFNVQVTGDIAAGRDVLRQALLYYYSTPVYNKFLAWCGFEEEAARIAEGFAARDRAQTWAALDDTLVEKLAVVGDADKCRAEVREFLAAGVNTPLINAVSTEKAEAGAVMEAFAPDNFS